ncbi:MAG TPA: TraB/GumN family protein [Allosphingosinicella sp.]|nr:TraB/GumN family protein [Allosphingosinicella sp.]
MLKYIGAAAMAGLALASAAPAQNPADQAQAEDIIVTGRRSGVPMWTVRSDRTTIVLVGAIAGVSKTTKWDPLALTEALRKADRVMFPQSHALTVSNPLNLIGWLAKYKKMGSLPKGQTLGQFVAPEHMRRLAALQARGMAQKGYEGRHPLHLSNDLRDRAKGKVDYGRNAADYVEKAIKTHKLKLAVDPIAKSKAKPVVKDLFASQPSDHVPCLIDSIAAAEAGPAAVQARSDAWAARRVPEVLASPADKVHSSCWPYGAGIGPTPDELFAEMRGLLDDDQVTMAVLGLRTLAESGGILDRLQAAGFDIQGPAWK